MERIGDAPHEAVSDSTRLVAQSDASIEPHRAPVGDWATDFDIFDPRWAADPHGIIAAVREAGCPVARTERFGGVSMPISWDLVREVAYDTDRFSSRRLLVTDGGVPADVAERAVPPLTSDPPVHRGHRLPLVAPMSLDAVERMRPRMVASCGELVDAFIDRGTFDGSHDYAKHVATRAIANLLGLPEADGTIFHGWLSALLGHAGSDPAQVPKVYAEVQAYMFAAIMARLKQPRDDMITYLIGTEFETEKGKRKLDPKMLGGAIQAVLFAGIDTSWSAIGLMLRHLALHPSDQERLRADPSITPRAVEEMLRAYSPVNTGRVVVDDTTVGGCPMRKGEMVILSYPAANRDPRRFTNPDTVDFDRDDGQNAAFGFGIHRCVGLHLARMELQVAIDVLLARVRNLHVSADRDIVWEPGMIHGPRVLPLAFETV